MKSFLDLDKTFSNQPARVTARLGEIDRACGREALFEHQRPQLLKRLSEDARVSSITASNAIEGINVRERRAAAIAAGAMSFRDRSEKEYAGYRDALDGLMREPLEPVSVPSLMHIHRVLLSHTDARGGYLKSEPNQIVSRERGFEEVVYVPPPPDQTEFLLGELINRYDAAQRERAAHPVLLVAAFALDLLSIHPFADGNGRTTRLVSNSELMVRGYGVVRYVSLEQYIFESKNSYYAALYQSQRNWVESDGAHDIWPWAEYFVSVLEEAYKKFETLSAEAGSFDGMNKQQQVEHWVQAMAPDKFTRADAESALPGISPGTIISVLNRLREDGRLTSSRGRSAVWTKLPNAQEPGS